ncbi:MAG: hypothetical protein QOF78_2269 [Phycisphaerales bacterium]|jgi:hypothetical protein|nr:hypothetical protein [Phycisphaerales bacterium]
MRIASAIIFGVATAALLLGGVASAMAQATTVAAPLPAIYSASTTYALKANGNDIPVVAFSDAYDYATLSADAACQLQITRLDGKRIAHHEISPQRLNIAATTRGTQRGATLSFKIAKPAYLIVAIDDLRKLAIAIDPPETNKPPASGPGIFNVTAAPYGADATGKTSATPAIQKAIDAAAADASKKGIVFVPNGVYSVSELRLLSNVSLYLEAGAVLRLTGTRDELTKRFHKKSRNADGTWMIYTAAGASNVRIFGRGTIDGDGKRIQDDQKLLSHLVVPVNCTGFTMDGPVCRDSGLWGVVVANSSDVALRNTKHFNFLDMGEDDCVDVCNSQNVTVTRSIGISLDDPYSTKTWAGGQTDISKQWGGGTGGAGAGSAGAGSAGTLQPNRNIVFDDCLAWTRCFAFKIGAGVWQDQENITVRNCVVYDSAHAIGISHSYGSGDVRNVLFESIDVERNTMTNLGRSWARFVIDPRKSDGGAGGGVFDVVVRNINVRDPGTDAVAINGLNEQKRIAGVKFEGIRIRGKTSPASTLAQIGVTEPRFAEGVTMDTRAETPRVIEGSIHLERAQ